MLNTESSIHYESYMKPHICELDQPEDPVVTFIRSGYFVGCRRIFRKLLTVSDNTPGRKNYLKSNALLRQEQRRHLRYHFYMIHPFSIFRWYWELVMMCVFAILFLITPIEISTLSPIWWLKSFKFSLDIICLFDVVLTFFSGFYIYKTKKIVLNFRSVASEYLKTYFIPDFFSSIPIDFILCCKGYDDDYWYFKTLSYLKIFRMPTFISYFKNFQSEFVVLSSMMLIKMFKVLLLLTFSVFWVSSLTYVIYRDASWLPSEVIDTPTGFLITWYWTVTNMLLIGDSFHNENPGEILYTIAMLCFGFLLEILIYGNIAQIMYENTNTNNKYKRIKQQLREYAHYKELPEIIRRRMSVYYEFRFQRVYYNESDLLSLLSDQLREEINIYHCNRLVAQVDFFKALPPSLLSHIVKCMKFEIFLTNDVIVRAGTVGDCMYFIRLGSVAIYTSNGKEVCHISDGSHFGEIAILMEKELRVASVVAAECCELYNLRRVDFLNIIEPYPELKERIRKIAQERLQNTIKFMETTNTI